MDLTGKALEAIRRLREARGLDEGVGLRIGRRGGAVRLSWDAGAARESDLVVSSRGVRVLVDAQTYLRLADFALDCERRGAAWRFLLRPRRWNGRGHYWMADPAQKGGRRRTS